MLRVHSNMEWSSPEYIDAGISGLRKRFLAAALLCAGGLGCATLPAIFRPGAAAECKSLIEQARRSCQGGDHEQAKKLLTRAAQIAPDDPEIQRTIGRALLLAGERDSAVKHLQYACRQGVDDPQSYLEMARILLEDKKYDECQVAAEAALRMVPSLAEAQLIKGKLAELTNHEDEALAIYYRLLASDPSDFEAMLRIADLLVQSRRSSQAAPLLRTIVESDRVPSSVQEEARWQLGLVYGREHRWNEASIQLAAAAESRPQLTASELYQLAYAYWEAGDLEKTRQYASRVLAIEPHHADALALDATARAESSPTQTAYSRLPLPAPAGW